MKNTIKTLILGLSVVAATAPAFAQPYGYGRDRDSDYEERGPRYRDRDRGYEDYGDRRRDGYGRGGGFDAAEYIRCNPDVARALRNGQLTSAADHYRVFGRREGRRLSC